MDSAMPVAVRFLMTRISGSAPALRIALAASYSQFVPGKTGMRTLGLAALMSGFFQLSLSWDRVGMFSCFWSMLQA